MYKFIKNKLLYKSSVFTDILIGFAILLAGYFYYYENRRIVSNIENSQNVNYAIKITLAVIIIVVWMMLSFQNGVKKRNSFFICTISLWILPQIIKMFVERIDINVYSGTLQGSLLLFTKYLTNINYLSLKTFGDMIYINIGIPYVFTLNFTIILFELMFFAGFIIGNRFDITENIEINET